MVVENISNVHVNTILIVDDEQEILRLLERLLKKEGYRTIQASAAMEALVLVQEYDIDLVITDIRMPGMDGLELVTQIHDLKPGLPVMVISGYGNFNTAVESVEKGAFFFVNKPFDRTQILDVVSRGLRLSRLDSGQIPPPGETRITLEFHLEPDISVITPTCFQIVEAARNMGYPDYHKKNTIPFIVDEFLLEAISRQDAEEEKKPIQLKVILDAEQVEIFVTTAYKTFLRKELTAPFEEFDITPPRGVGLMMARHYAEKIDFSEDGKEAAVLIRKQKMEIL